MSLAEAALGLARGGWLVFPCHSVGADGFCSCGKPGCLNVAKHPRWAKGSLENGLKDANSDPVRIMEWWGKWPEANIGLRTGAGMFVLDPDGPEGTATIDGMDLPATLTATTGRGRHLYFFAPEGVEIRNRARVAPGLDVRGDDGYVIAPPSVHASGTVYAWVDQDAEIAEAPEWLVELVRVQEYVAPEPSHAPPSPRQPTRSGDVSPYARAALDAEVRNVLDAPRGVQNDTLNRAAFALGQLVASGALPESEVCSALMGAWDALEPGNGPGMAAGERTMRSGLESGMRYPRDVLKPRTRREPPKELSEGRPTPVVSDRISPQVTERQDEIVAATFALKQEASTNGSRSHVEYPLGVWPGPIADLIAETARAVCVEPAAVGTAVLAVAAGAIGRARWLDVKGEGGWIERPGIYAGLVGEVSRRKSPVLETVTEPLERMHGEAAARWLRDQEQWEEGGSKGKEPELSSLLLKDVTTEVLAHALQAHPRGVTLVADELVGWLNGMGQYKGGKGNDRQRWLEAHKARTIDVRRVGRKPIVVEHPCVGILGGVQPEVFGGLTSVRDGLAERFLYCVMPKVALDASTPDVSRRARATWESIVRALYALTEAEIVCEVPGCLTEARQRALDLHASAPAALEGYLGKGEMHLARIGIVLATVWEVCGGGDRSLTAAGVGRAEDLWGFYAEQGASLFSGDVVPVRAYAFASPAAEQELAAWVRAQGGCSTKRDAMNSGPLRGLSAKEADVVIYTAAARGRLGAAPGERRDSLVLTVSGE